MAYANALPRRARRRSSAPSNRRARAPLQHGSRAAAGALMRAQRTERTSPPLGGRESPNVEARLADCGAARAQRRSPPAADARRRWRARAAAARCCRGLALGGGGALVIGGGVLVALALSVSAVEDAPADSAWADVRRVRQTPLFSTLGFVLAGVSVRSRSGSCAGTGDDASEPGCTSRSGRARCASRGL